MSKRNKKKNRRFTSIIFILSLFFVLFLASAAFAYIKLSKINTVKINQNPSSLGINEQHFNNSSKLQKDFINILIMGIDAQKEVNDAFSADTIMIATIDKQHKELKLTSIMRDSLVNVDGVGDTKLKYAYSYGGPSLLIKTVNQSFNMNIQDYIKVNFSDAESIVDYLGGVEINVKPEEITLLNYYQRDISGLEKKDYTPIKKSGLQNLNGMQAVAYTRIRYVGNYDFERTERQRRVLTEILKKFSGKNIVELSSLSEKLLPYVETSLSNLDVISLGSYIVINKLTKPQQFRIPTDKTYHDYTNPKDGLYYMKWDKQPTIDALHNFIFETT
jgi:polyisoprenyl-teichoic acid--peptidoglycan teichoic acid transferase